MRQKGCCSAWLSLPRKRQLKMCSRLSRSQARLLVGSCNPPQWDPSYHLPACRWEPAAVEMTLLVNDTQVLGAGYLSHKLCSLFTSSLFPYSGQMHRVNLSCQNSYHDLAPLCRIQVLGLFSETPEFWLFPQPLWWICSQNMDFSQLQIHLAPLISFW